MVNLTQAIQAAIYLPVNVLSQLFGGTRFPFSSTFPGLQKYQSRFPRLGSFRARLDVWNHSCFTKDSVMHRFTENCS